jgi:hypothetical protein
MFLQGVDPWSQRHTSIASHVEVHSLPKAKFWGSVHTADPLNRHPVAHTADPLNRHTLAHTADPFNRHPVAHAADPQMEILPFAHPSVGS